MVGFFADTLSCSASHKLITGKDEDEEPASEGEAEQESLPRYNNDPRLAEMLKKLEETYKQLSEETEGLRKENAELKAA